MKKFFRKFYLLIERLYDKKVDATGLAFFRFFYSLNLVCEVATLYHFRQLVYEGTPFTESGISISIGLALWIIVLCFIAIGLFTRPASILNYILSLLFIGTAHEFEYNIFYVYSGINFLLMFMDTGQVFSVDRLLKKIRYSTTRFTYNPPTTVSVLNYYFPLFFGIAVVYIDSVIYKLASPNWWHGLGVWLPSSLCYVSVSNHQWLLNQKMLMIGMSYFTVLFEVAFLFFFWHKRWRIPLMVSGFILHLAIYYEYPIPWFAIGVATIYVLMIPLRWWSVLFEKIKRKTPVLDFYYDGECPLCKRTVLVLSHFDITNSINFFEVQRYYQQTEQLKSIPLDELLLDIYSIDRKGKIAKGFETYRKICFAIPYLIPLGILISIPGISHLGKLCYEFISRDRIVERCTEENCHIPVIAPPVNRDEMKFTQRFSVKKLKVIGIATGLFIGCLFQLNVSLMATPFRYVKNKYIFKRWPVAEKINDKLTDVMYFSRYAFGITTHGLFLDSHFNNYNRITAIVRVKPDGTDEWLPIITKEGRPGKYLVGFMWANWTFRVNVRNPYDMKLERGIEKYTRFYLLHNLLSTDHADFKIMVKKIRCTRQWEKDYLKEQLETPWEVAGTASYRKGQFNLRFPDQKDFPFDKQLVLPASSK